MKVTYLTFVFIIIYLVKSGSWGAVLPPPWADPRVNPCATRPRGWQMLYWPLDGMCYKIFKMGYPCPASMELSPSTSSSGAECRCPPKTLRAQNSTDCHTIFTKGPCQSGEFLAPDTSKPLSSSRLGVCIRPVECPDPTQLAWPQDGRCYRRMSRGPCIPGSILVMDENNVPTCQCSETGESAAHRWDGDGRCYEHYTRGPCPFGQLYLPGGRCACFSDSPHYHSDSKSCYEIGSIGPCNKGHRFTLSMDEPNQAKCRCKPNNALWKDGVCYRLYTRGPCGPNELLAPPSRCVPLPCRRSRLYFPEHKRCFRIGTQGPCDVEQVVIFDFEARPSVDGIAYNGICGCAGVLALDKVDACLKIKMADSNCADTPGMVVMDGACHMLYTKGPCGDGQWLVPGGNNTVTGKAECGCKPGFTRYFSDSLKSGIKKDELKLKGDKISCLPPTVTLARYLNTKYNKAT